MLTFIMKGKLILWSALPAVAIFALWAILTQSELRGVGIATVALLCLFLVNSPKRKKDGTKNISRRMGGR